MESRSWRLIPPADAHKGTEPYGRPEGGFTASWFTDQACKRPWRGMPYSDPSYYRSEQTRFLKLVQAVEQIDFSALGLDHKLDQTIVPDLRCRRLEREKGFEPSTLCLGSRGLTG